MKKNTYVIIDSGGRYYSSFFDAFLIISHSRVFVLSTTNLEEARKYRFLRWAMHRAKYLSIKASDYYYVYEVKGEGAEQKNILRNEHFIERLRKRDSEAMEEVERIIAEWKASRGLD